MLRAWCRYLLIFAICALLYLFFGGYLFLLFLLCVLALPIISLLAMLLQCHTLNLDFQRRKEGSFFTCTSGKFFPLAQIIVQVSYENLFLSLQQKKTFYLFTSDAQVCIPLYVHDDAIGKIRLYYDGYELRDVLGLFKRTYKRKKQRAYYLFPHAQEHLGTKLLSDLLNEEEHVWEGHMQNGGILEDKHEVKEYQPGDDLRRIHHKLSYKLGKTMIREFASFQQEQLLIYLDLHGSVEDCEQVLGQFYTLALEWIKHDMSALVCWSSQDGNMEQEVNSMASLKRCLQVILSHPKAETEDNVLYCSQLGTHLCIRANGIETAKQKGSD